MEILLELYNNGTNDVKNDIKQRLIIHGYSNILSILDPKDNEKSDELNQLKKRV
jgi:hypothetical protein